MVFGGNFLNHTLASPFSVVENALHIISSETPWRCIVVLNVAMWLQGSCVPPYESKVGILNLEHRGWLVMDAMKGESILWMRSSTWFAISWNPLSFHLVHLSLQMWYPTGDGTPWLVSFSIVLSTFISWILTLLSTMLLTLSVNFSS